MSMDKPRKTRGSKATIHQQILYMVQRTAVSLGNPILSGFFFSNQGEKMDRKEYHQALESIEKNAYAVRKVFNLLPEELKAELRVHGLNKQMIKSLNFWTYRTIGIIHQWKAHEKNGNNKPFVHDVKVEK